VEVRAQEIATHSPSNQYPPSTGRIPYIGPARSAWPEMCGASRADKVRNSSATWTAARAWRMVAFSALAPPPTRRIAAEIVTAGATAAAQKQKRKASGVCRSGSPRPEMGHKVINSNWVRGAHPYSIAANGDQIRRRNDTASRSRFRTNYAASASWQAEAVVEPLGRPA